MVTLTDVARRSGVSVSVVSRVLNDDPALRVRPETRDRVRLVAKELAYTPNHAARSLRLAQAGAIAVIVPDFTNAIFTEVLRGVEEGADEAGLIVLLGRSERLRPGSDFLRRLAGEGRVDGILVQRRDEVEQQEFEHILGQNLPVILINTRGSKRGSVVVDDVAATQVATQHLLDLGHRDLGFVGGVPVSYTGRVRAKGFAQTLSHNGIRRRTAWTTSLGYSPQAGYEAGLSLLQGVRRPTGLIVANINAALGVVRAAHQLGLSLPDDVSIVAIHDNWQSQYVTPELTAVQLPLYELGRVAVQQLIGRLAGESAADVMVSDPAPVLTVRNTSGPPP